MKIFIMRHGEAEHFADSDAARQLTPRGRVESEAVARACKEQGFAQFDKVLVSPYIRAQQTWQEISEYFAAKSIETCEDITPYGQSEHVFSSVFGLNHDGSKHIPECTLGPGAPVLSSSQNGATRGIPLYTAVQRYSSILTTVE